MNDGMGETFKCCNCGFVCEIINSERLDMGIAECERCGMKGLRRQDPDTTFVESFRNVIAMVDPQANSLMSKDMPPSLKILADWSRKACDELTAANERNRWIPASERLPTETGEYLVLPAIKHCPTLWFQGGWYWYDRTDDAICETIGHNMDEPLPTITHWMPLPEQEGT